LEIDQILDSLVIESIKLVDAQSGFAAIIDADKYSAKRYFNQDHWEYSDLTWDFESKISIQFKNKKEGYIINNVGDDSLIHPDLKTKYSVIQSISVPLFGANGELMGFFETHNKKNSNGFNQNDLNHLKALAHNASISLTKSLSIEQLRKTELQLRNSESELRQLAAQLQYARETERHHLAREVHDELGQLFTGINLNILYLRDTIEQNDENLNIQRIISELNEVKKMVDKGIQSVRDIAEGLRSYVLEHLGLVHAIKEYCKEFKRVSNIKCTITTYSEDINLGEEKSIAIYRIIQESLTNAMRHSKASEIKIDFSKNSDRIDISIEDNGIGFEEMNSRRVKTFGILGMKERALYINGTLTITSKPGSGTLIKVSLPLTEVLKNERI
jgi:signal transduction histidine kinase